MSDLFDAAAMTINCSHDSATALLAVSCLTMWMLFKKYPDNADDELELNFLRIYKSLTRIAKVSLCWTVIAGVLRIIYFRGYEWSDTASDIQAAAIIIRYAVIFLIAGIGLFYWSRLARKVRKLELKYNLS